MGEVRPQHMCLASYFARVWAAERQLEAGSMLWGCDSPAVSASLYTAVQWAISGCLWMAPPQLAGDGLGFELWRTLAREHEAPEQPMAQRAYQTCWAYPKCCKDESGLRARPSQWETWGMASLL